MAVLFIVMNEVDQRLYNDKTARNSSELEILNQYMDYMQEQLNQGVLLKHMSRHLLGLFTGKPGAKAWRRHISENAYKKGAGIEVIQQAVNYLS